VIFRDKISGASKERPKWEEVKTAVHRGDVSAVVFWALDRAGRDRVACFHDIAEFFRKGMTIVSVQEPMVDQPPGPMRDLAIFWLAQAAECERKKNSDRTILGLQAALDRGARLGRRSLAGMVIGALRKAWRLGVPVTVAAGNCQVPPSTARTYYARFEAAKKGSENTTQQTAESQED
jgi:DNA invertase Pin-like site-specific DNA recombinase